MTRRIVRSTFVVMAILLLTGSFNFRGSVNAATSLACTVNYNVQSQWPGGFTTSVTILNQGTSSINGWTLGFTFPGDQKITQGWSANWTQSGANVTAQNASWNGTIPANGSVSIGFNGSYTSNNTSPSSFTLNGSVCGAIPPTVSITSPADGATFQSPANIPIQVSASDSSASISRVEFYNGSTLLGTATAAPYNFSWNSVPAGSYTLTAIAYASNGTSTTSAPIHVTVGQAQQPSILTNTAAIDVTQGGSAQIGVDLSTAPVGNVTVTSAVAAGATGVTISQGATLTFTPSNWNQAQYVTVAAAANAAVGSTATITSSANGYSSASVTATVRSGSTSTYTQRFLKLYNMIKDPANGYFSSLGIPYHSVETLIVEAPDYGHETTSETFSYWIWLEATYGEVTGNWQPFNNAWATMEKYMIPSHADQPTNSGYNPSSPAEYAPESPDITQYPTQLSTSVSVGQDPLANELKQTYNTSDIYGMHWLLDTDNWYKYGHCGDGTTKPSYINTFQRGASESVWKTVPQPECETFTWGRNDGTGFLSLFNTPASGGSYSKQWRYTDAPDADARTIQAAFWAYTWATAQGKESQISPTIAKAAMMGDYLRYAMYDKYFKQMGCQSVSCPAGTGKNSSDYLLGWYYAWGGSLDTNSPWAWRIGSSSAHQGYQNPLTAWALSSVPALEPLSPTGASDWKTSLQRQLEFYRWLQSSEGGIAGGATNSWNGNYSAPPAGDPTFYGMSYDWQPVYHDPPSNNWFGFQAWSMERVAEYYYETGDTTAKAILDKWVAWASANTTLNADGTYAIPSTLSWTGQPDTWNPASPGSNAGLHVKVVDTTNDVGVAAALAKTLLFYSAKAKDTASHTLGQQLLDRMWSNYLDSIGLSVPEVRKDYNQFNISVYIPSGWVGKMADGATIDSSSTFISLRPQYQQDPAWPKVQAYLNGGAAPTFNYHRFWAEADIAIAMANYDMLFPAS